MTENLHSREVDRQPPTGLILLYAMVWYGIPVGYQKLNHVIDVTARDSSEIVTRLDKTQFSVLLCAVSYYV